MVNGTPSQIPESFTFDLDLWVIRNVAQFPLHHVTYAPAKFEVTSSNEAFTKKYIS